MTRIYCHNFPPLHIRWQMSYYLMWHYIFQKAIMIAVEIRVQHIKLIIDILDRDNCIQFMNLYFLHRIYSQDDNLWKLLEKETQEKKTFQYFLPIFDSFPFLRLTKRFVSPQFLFSCELFSMWQFDFCVHWKYILVETLRRYHSNVIAKCYSNESAVFTDRVYLIYISIYIRFVSVIC